MLRAGGQAAGR